MDMFLIKIYVFANCERVALSVLRGFFDVSCLL